MYSVSEICRWIDGKVVNAEALGSRLESIRVDRPGVLSRAKSSELAYFFSKTYQSELPGARPGILVTGPPFVDPLAASGLPLWKESAVIACVDPYLAMALLSTRFATQLSTVVYTPEDRAAEAAETFGKPVIHASAVVDPTADLGAGVQVGANVVISEHVRVGAGTVIYPGAFLGPHALVGERCVLFPNVVLYEQVVLGNDVRIHAGSVLGADGFGYAPKTKKVIENGVERIEVHGHQKIYHLGRVVVGDHVEIGALSTIDRGTIDDTRVDRYAKIDDNVHLGHNTHVQEGAILCGGIAMAGGSSVGKWAYVAGMVGITNDVHVGEGAKVAAASLLTKDVPKGATAAGNPQREYSEHFKVHGLLNRLAKNKGRKS